MPAAKLRWNAYSIEPPSGSTQSPSASNRAPIHGFDFRVVQLWFDVTW